MSDGQEWLRVRSITEALAELEGIMNSNYSLYLNKANTSNVISRLKFMLNTYLSSLDGLNLATKPIGEGDSVDLADRKALERAKNSLALIEGLVDVVKQQAEGSADQMNALYNASTCMRQEGLFSPAQVYQLKEDLETVSQLHTEYKKVTNKVMTENNVVLKRNATLKIEAMNLEVTNKELEKANYNAKLLIDEYRKELAKLESDNAELVTELANLRTAVDINNR